MNNFAKLIVDSFTGEKKIKSECLGIAYRYNNGDYRFLFIELLNKGGKDFVKISFDKKAFNIALGDKISIMLENGHVMDFDIVIEPYSIGNGSNETFFQLADSDLQVMKKFNLSKMRIENIKTGYIITVKIDIHTDFDLSKQGSQKMVEIPSKISVNDYCNLVVAEIENYQSVNFKQIDNEKLSNNDECYVYLMVDTSNNYHKIGISNKPVYREKTLQSEKPTIEMICNKRFPNRKIALSIESALHQVYSEKRIRGEWFDLDKIEINELKEVLS